MEAYGQRVQQSVFECILAPEQMALLQHDLDQIIDQGTDSVRIYRLREPHNRYTHLIGRQTKVRYKGSTGVLNKPCANHRQREMGESFAPINPQNKTCIRGTTKAHPTHGATLAQGTITKQELVIPHSLSDPVSSALRGGCGLKRTSPQQMLIAP